MPKPKREIKEAYEEFMRQYSPIEAERVRAELRRKGKRLLTPLEIYHLKARLAELGSQDWISDIDPRISYEENVAEITEKYGHLPKEEKQVIKENIERFEEEKKRHFLDLCRRIADKEPEALEQLKEWGYRNAKDFYTDLIKNNILTREELSEYFPELEEKPPEVSKIKSRIDTLKETEENANYLADLLFVALGKEGVVRERERPLLEDLFVTEEEVPPDIFYTTERKNVDSLRRRLYFAISEEKLPEVVENYKKAKATQEKEIEGWNEERTRKLTYYCIERGIVETLYPPDATKKSVKELKEEFKKLPLWEYDFVKTWYLPKETPKEIADYLRKKEEVKITPEERKKREREELKKHLSEEIERATSGADLDWIIDEIMRYSAENKLTSEDELELHRKIKAKRKELKELEKGIKIEKPERKRPKSLAEQLKNEILDIVKKPLMKVELRQDLYQTYVDFYKAPEKSLKFASEKLRGRKSKKKILEKLLEYREKGLTPEETPTITPEEFGIPEEVLPEKEEVEEEEVPEVVPKKIPKEEEKGPPWVRFIKKHGFPGYCPRPSAWVKADEFAKKLGWSANSVDVIAYWLRAGEVSTKMLMEAGFPIDLIEKAIEKLKNEGTWREQMAQNPTKWWE